MSALALALLSTHLVSRIETTNALSVDLLSDDPKLKKEVTVSLKNTALALALKSLSTQTGVALSVPKQMVDRKVTILVDGVPAALVLSKISDVLMCEWKPAQTGYTISQPSDIGNFRNSFITREDALLRESAQKQIQQFTQYAAQPYDVLLQRKMQIESSQNPNDPAYVNNATQRQRLAKELSAVNACLDPVNYGAGMVLKSVSYAGLWQGNVSAGRVPAYAAGPSRAFQPAAVGAQYVLVRYSAVDHAIAVVGPNREPRGGVQVNLPNALEKLKTHAFAKMVTDWADVEGGAGPTSFQQPIEVRGEGVPVADLLQSIHDQAKVPIVAEGSRFKMFVNSRADNLKEFVRVFTDTTKGYVRLHDGVLEFRHPSFWRMQQTEVPEFKLAELETLNDQGKLALNPYAAFVAGLERTQIDALATGHYAVNFPLDPLQKCWAGLVLYGQLNQQQKQIAYSGSFFYGQLTAQQKQAADEAILQAAFLQPLINQVAISRIIEQSANARYLAALGVSVRMASGADSVNGGEGSTISIGDDQTLVSYRVALPLLPPGALGYTHPR